MAALSPATPTLPIDPDSLWRLRAWTIFRLRNCDPRSEWTIQLAHLCPVGCPTGDGVSIAVTASRDFIRE
jgi:hypothetical protein